LSASLVNASDILRTSFPHSGAPWKGKCPLVKLSFDFNF
jgi:hypothetical protein